MKSVLICLSLVFAVSLAKSSGFVRKKYDDVEDLLERFLSKVDINEMKELELTESAIDNNRVGSILNKRTYGGQTLSSESQQAILAKHNEARANASSTIPALTWDDNLASTASAYAAQCIYAHNANRGSNIGENLYVKIILNPPTTYTHPAQTDTVSNGVVAWVNEKVWWTYPSSCSPPPYKSCGHYTQVIWKNTLSVGCGYAICSNMFYPSDATYYLVCNYSPAGNQMIIGPPY